MDIGSSEMTQKIRSAIKAKLVDLGSYVDDELPDYIMVMVANKKSEAQMTDDLSLFLGNNTLIFTSWLHSVLNKLSQPAPEPKPKKVKESSAKNKKIKDKKPAGPSAATKSVDPHPIKAGHSLETTIIMPPTAPKPTLTAVKGLKPEPTQVVISLKPETNDFLDEELAQEVVDSEAAKRQPAVISPLQPKVLSRALSQQKEVIKKVPSNPSVTIKVSPTLAVQTSRKRKAPGSVIGQVLNVQEDEDSDEPSSFGKKVASTVLPQRRPTLPVSKQANTSLLKKAVCAAEASTSEVLTTLAKREPPKTAQTGLRRIKIVRKLQSSVPRRNLLLKAVSDAKQSIKENERSKSRLRLEIPAPGLVSRSKIKELSERDYDAQEFITLSDSSTSQQVEEYYADDEEQDDNEVLDTRQICMETEMPSQPVIYVIRDENVKKEQQPVYTPTPEVVESSQSETSPTRPLSPKFIVTLEGAVKPNTKQRKSARVAPRLSSFTRTIDNSSMYADFVHMQQQKQQAEEEHVLQQKLRLAQQEAALLQQKNQLLEQRALEEYPMDEDIHVYSRQTHHLEKAEEEKEEQFDKEEVSSPNKERSASERCLFWPACRKGSDCVYVHPTTPCRTFPNCKFGDKCLFIHPNCKYDARCSRTNCPFTHATRKQASQGPVSPTVIVSPIPVPQKVAKVCRFYPNCTNASCTFLHPKMCMYGRACTRSDCLFTHPKVATGAALKWTKQSHISERQFSAKGTAS